MHKRQGTPPTPPNKNYVKSVLKFNEFYENREDPEMEKRLRFSFLKLMAPSSGANNSTGNESGLGTNLVDRASRRFPFAEKRNSELIEGTRTEESAEKSVKFLKSVFYASRLSFGPEYADKAGSTEQDRSDYRFFILKLVIEQYLKPEEGHFSSSEVSQFAGFVMGEIELMAGSDCVDLILDSFGSCFWDGKSSSCKYWADAFCGLLTRISKITEVIDLGVDGKLRGSPARERLIEKLCAEPWSVSNENILKTVVAFQDAGLSDKELLCVIGKSLAELKKVELDEIPSIVYQLLTLSSKKHRSFVLARICALFGELELICETRDTNESNVDNSRIPDLSKLDKLKKSEATVILYFLQHAKQNPEYGKSLLKSLKENKNLFECSFAIALLMGLTQIQRLKEEVLLLFKFALIAFYRESEQKMKCSWLKSCLPPTPDIPGTIQNLVKSSCVEWEAVLQGVVELGFSLMDVHLAKISVVGGRISEGMGPQTSSQSACAMGHWLLEECFTRHEVSRSSILEGILFRIPDCKDQGTAFYYIDLLSTMVAKGKMTFLENKTKIADLLDHVGLMSVEVATPLIKCLLPVIKLNPGLRDGFLVTLKKAMFEREIEPRKVAVVGFLLFMKHFQVLSQRKPSLSLGSGSSQMSQSFPTFSSQAYGSSQDNSVGATQRKYEALCLEAIGCLRRCFSQKAEIRTILYRGLVEVVRKNVELLDPVVELLFRQLEMHLNLTESEEGEDHRPSLLMEKVILARKDDVELMEPLGELILALVQLVNVAKRRDGQQERDGASIGTTFLQADFEVDEDQENRLSIEFNRNLLQKVKETLYELATRFVEDKLEDYGLTKDSDFSAEGSGPRNVQTAISCLAVYEALFDAVWWAMDYETQTAELLTNLYKKRTELSLILKEKNVQPGVGKKVAGANNREKRAFGNPARKDMDVICVQVETLVSFLDKILCDQKPSHDEGLTILRQEKNMLSWIYELTLSKVTTFAKRGDLEHNFSTKRMDSLCQLGRLMMTQFTENAVPEMLCREDGASELRPLRHAAIGIYEKVLECLVAVYSNKTLDVLGALRENSDGPPFYSVAEAAMAHFENNLAMARELLDRANPENKSTDASFCVKEAHCLFRCVRILVHLIPTDSKEFEEAFRRVNDTCKSRNFEDVQLGKLAWQILYYMQTQKPQRPGMLVAVAENLGSSQVLGLANEDPEAEQQEPKERYKSITKKTGNDIAKLTVGQINFWLENVEVMIEKLRKEADALPKLGRGRKSAEADSVLAAPEAEELSRMRRERETKLCYLLTVVINGLGELALVKLNGKILEEMMLKCISKAFKVLGMWTDYYKLLSEKKSGDLLGHFPKLAEAAGHNFTKKVSGLLDLFLTGERNQQAGESYSRTNAMMKLLNQYTKEREGYEEKLWDLSKKTGNKALVKGIKHTDNLDFKWIPEELPEQAATQESEPLNSDEEMSDAEAENIGTQNNQENPPHRAKKRLAETEIDSQMMPAQRGRFEV